MLRSPILSRVLILSALTFCVLSCGCAARRAGDSAAGFLDSASRTAQRGAELTAGVSPVLSGALSLVALGTGAAAEGIRRRLCNRWDGKTERRRAPAPEPEPASAEIPPAEPVSVHSSERERRRNAA